MKLHMLGRMAFQSAARAARTWPNSAHVVAATCATTAAVALVSSLWIGCSTAGNADTAVVLAAPDRAAFNDVSPALVRSCGTLDCHGSRLRNMRMFGYGTGRLAAADSPLAPATSAAELDENYRAVVGLEPEVMSAVVRDKGANSQRLSLIRKGRGLDNHKGGARMVAGDNLEKCLVGWLSGNFDKASCEGAE